jgi:hypothetical protein
MNIRKRRYSHGSQKDVKSEMHRYKRGKAVVVEREARSKVASKQSRLVCQKLVEKEKKRQRKDVNFSW